MKEPIAYAEFKRRRVGRAVRERVRFLKHLLDRPSLYVYRDVRNADELIAWAQRQGVTNLLPAHDLHVTVVYSRAPVHGLAPVADYVTEPSSAWVRCQHLGDKGAVVAMFESKTLSARWQEARDHGASWDYDSGYHPHVTLSYKSDVVPASVPPFEIVLGPERHEAVDDTWADQFRKHLFKYSPDQPRDDHGQWTDGGGGGSHNPAERFNSLPSMAGELGGTYGYKENPLRQEGAPVGDTGAWTTLREPIEQLLEQHGPFARLLRNATEETVDLNNLVTYQRWLNPERFTYVERLQDQPLGVVVSYEGKDVIVDGNHRLAFAKLSGKSSVKVLRIHLNKKLVARKTEAPPLYTVSAWGDERVVGREPKWRKKAVGPVLKADSPPHITAAVRRAQQLAKRLAAELRGYGEALVAARLETAIQTNSLFLIEQAINFANLGKVLQDLVRPAMQEEFLRGARVGDGQLRGAGVAIRFNAMDPRAVQWANRNAAKLVTEVTDDQKRMVAEVVRDAQAEGHTYKEVAQDLRTFLGLRSDQVKALTRYRADIAADHGPTEVARLVDKYARFLLKNRTETIARHELLTSTHEGQLQAVREGINQGLVNPERTQRVWNVADDERLCEICRPMDGQAVDADEPWTLVADDDRKVWVPQEAHVQCRCSFSLVTKHA